MQKNTRSAWTCENCRRRKVKCDSKDPCVHCARRREQCTWPGNVQLRPELTEAVARAQDTANLLARVERIEAVLGKSGLLLATSSDIEATPELEETQEIQHVEIDDLADAVHGDRLQLEVHRHDDFDHHIIIGSPTALRNGADHVRAPGRAAGQIAIAAKRLVDNTLPARPRCDELLESYWYHVEWIHHPLHVPSFMAAYELFWQRYDQSDALPDLQWLALLMILLCLGGHFHPTESSVKQEEELYAASHELLVLSNHLANHSVTVIQTLILMGLWLNDRGLSNTHHAQLALAIKMAMNLGLGKLDAASSRVFPKDDNTFFNVHDVPTADVIGIEHEIKRRLWWSLVCQDYYTASSCHFAYSIHPKQCKTDLFLNIDDQDLLADTDASSTTAVSSLQISATSSSYQLLKIPFARVAKAMTDLYNDDDLSYEAVLDLEKLLWTTYDGLPDYFKWQLNDDTKAPVPASQHVMPEHLAWQRLFLGFTVHNRVLRLHRPFMAHGYSNPAMIQSRRATIESALACLALAEQGREINFPGLRWWVVLVHIFTSGVALCIDYHYLLRFQRQATAPVDLSELTRSRREHITRTLKLLRTASASSVAAARAVSVLTSLVQQAETSPEAISHGPARKRMRHHSSIGGLSSASHSAQDVLSNNTYPDSGESYVEDYSTFQAPDDWLTTMNVDDWSGPDWDELFGSLSDGYSPQGMSADLYETINSFANGFAPT